MNYEELTAKMNQLIAAERKITTELLLLILEAEKSRLYIGRGFSSLFDWLVRGFGYSEGAAQRRIDSARALRAVPAAREKLESGDLNLTTLAKTQVAIRAQEKVSGKLSTSEKAQIVESVENKTAKEAEKTLVNLLPAFGEQAKAEVKRVKGNGSRLAFDLPEGGIEELERVKELVSHILPGASMAELVVFLAKYYRKKNDPELTATVAAVSAGSTNPNRRICEASKKREVLKEGRCTYKDPVTGRECNSRFQIQVDHIQPRALGGSNDAKNLRALCRTHNLYMSEKILGPIVANQWRK